MTLPEAVRTRPLIKKYWVSGKTTVSGKRSFRGRAAAEKWGHPTRELGPSYSLSLQAGTVMTPDGF